MSRGFSSRTTITLFPIHFLGVYTMLPLPNLTTSFSTESATFSVLSTVYTCIYLFKRLSSAAPQKFTGSPAAHFDYCIKKLSFYNLTEHKYVMYVSGIGKTKFGILNASLPELAYGAMAKAVEDSGIDAEKIEAIYIGNFLGGSFQNQLHLNSIVASLLPKNKIPIVRMESACASGGAALHYALEGMHKFENVLVLGIEKMSDASTSNAAKYIGAAGDRILDQAEGLIFPANYALIAGQHMLKYGTTSNDLALVALKNHENANLNENAHFYGKKVNLEMIENSPMVCLSLRLYDCSPISDGAAAIVISKEMKSARDIEIIASAFTTDTISLAQRSDATTFEAARRAAESAYKQAKINAGDVDFAEVHDCFT